ncbi:MAG: sensor histidine kinase [Lachnospiraceae bacterium]|nr:sensor histidine kinase [Lachnospiraceae bacterium]
MRAKVRKGIRYQWVTAFLVLAVIPLVLVNIVYYYNTSKLVQQNVESMTKANLEQTRVSLDVWLESYEDILFQVYTDDGIVELVDRINAGEDVANNRKQLRKTLRGLFYTKDYVKSILIITESGELAFYDQLTASTTQTSWLNSMELSQAELYAEISSDNRTHLFSTGEKVVFGSNSCYLFHIGHRIIDYRDVDKQCGVVVVSIDEKLLEEVCAPPTENGFNFIVDSAGYLVSCAGSDRLGESVFPEGADPGTKTKAYRNIAERTGFLGDKELSVYSVQDEKTGWEIIRATNQNELVQGLHQQQKILGVIIALSLLSVLPMTERLKKSVVKQKNAEIAALEAQINPHFLYNTLDTINWMAIDRDEYEISNMITTLARILRYGISDSNGVVKIRDEVEWLKQYIFLQQTRLKNAFDCHINVAPELMDLTVHKLLLQPFIENAILHGFEGVDRTCSLQMEMKRDHDFIEIKIEDNGCGIPDEIVREMNQGIFRKTEDKNHIGMENAITRLHMYYGERTRIMIHSKQGEGTQVQIRIPITEAEEKSENSDR